MHKMYTKCEKITRKREIVRNIFSYIIILSLTLMISFPFDSAIFSQMSSLIYCSTAIDFNFALLVISCVMCNDSEHHFICLRFILS